MRATVAGIEKFTCAHDRGSSHGLSRIIRLAYWEHPDYVPLLKRAYQLWRELEETAGRKARACLSRPMRGHVHGSPPSGSELRTLEPDLSRGLNMGHASRHRVELHVY